MSCGEPLETEREDESEASWRTDINNNMEFIIRVQRLKALCHLIKQKHGMHKYSHKNQSHNNTLLHILIQSKVQLTHTETQHPRTHRVACTRTHTRARARAHTLTHTHVDCM